MLAHKILESVQSSGYLALTLFDLGLGSDLGLSSFRRLLETIG